jgi:hypothetical protein
MLMNDTIRSAVTRTGWLNSTPRVTKDFDLIVSVDLIASDAQQPLVSEILARRDFHVTGENPYWQFEKKLQDGPSILVDFHAPLPDKDRSDVRVEGQRVKHRRSLGERGIHGRQNPEAAGCALYPFQFELKELAIRVPNPLAWSVMKLVAMRDRWRSSQDASRSPEAREKALDTTLKHAQDVCRAVAMTTQDEFGNAATIARHIRAEHSFENARAIHAEFFKERDGRGCNFVRDHWTDDALVTIRETLSQWFG